MKSKDLALPAGGSLPALFLNDFASVGDFYTYNPADPASFRRRREYLNRSDYQNRDILIHALLAYNEKLGCTAATRRNIAKLHSANAAAVVTGQQAGILTGPLYTIYKTVTAVLLARQCEAELSIPVLPVFWVASEDHDFQEINHINIPDGRGGISRLTLPFTPAGKLSVGNIPALPAGLRLIEDLAYVAPEGEHKTEILALLQRTAQASGNLGEWCARLMSELFGRYGLVCFDPLESPFRALLSGFFRRALLSFQSVGAALADATGRLSARGITPQLTPEAENTNLFLYEREERLSLISGDGLSFRLRGRSGDTRRLAELIALTAARPDQFSPNVALRPVAQDIIFPTLAYVAGPGEIAYYAQLKDVYPVFGREMAIIYPRLSLTLVDAADAAALSSLGLDPAVVLQSGRQALDIYLARVDPVGIDTVFDALEKNFAAAYAELADLVTALNPDLRSLSEGNLGRILYQVNYLRRKAKQRLRRNNRASVRQFEAVLTNLLPRGEKQERVLNICPYLFRCGTDFIAALTEQLTLDNFLPKMLTLEE